MLVIDASMALAWVFERQQAADAQRAADLLSSCGRQPWWVPSLWHLEVAQRLSASLASFDRRLNEAAQRLELALAP